MWRIVKSVPKVTGVANVRRATQEQLMGTASVSSDMIFFISHEKNIALNILWNHIQARVSQAS